MVLNHRHDILLFWDSPTIVEIANGLRRYSEGHALPWRIHVELAWDRIASPATRSAVSALLVWELTPAQRARIDLPTVVWCRARPPEMAQDFHLWFDDQATGQEAARHVVQRGYRSFACRSTSPPQDAYRERRERAFVGELARLRFLCADRWCNHLQTWDHASELAWIASLPPHTAIFCHEDHGGRHLLTSLGNLGRSDLGVVSAGDFPFAESLGLSSVRLSFRLLGHHLGLFLHRRFSGCGDPAPPVPPLGVVARASTGTASPSSLLDAMQAWITEHPDRHADVAGLARRLGVSRSTLHRRSLRETGRSPCDHLRDLRLGLMREILLRETGSPIDALARANGWCDGPHLIREFKAAFGITPGALRAALSDA